MQRVYSVVAMQLFCFLLFQVASFCYCLCFVFHVFIFMCFHLGSVNITRVYFHC